MEDAAVKFNMTNLPEAARDKLLAIIDQAQSADDAARSAALRLNGLSAPGDAKQRERLQTQRERQAKRQEQFAVLASKIKQWLVRLPGDTVLESAPVIAKRHKDESMAQAITRVRDEITAAQSHLRAVQTAPLPKDEVKKLADAYVQQLGRPKVSVDSGVFKATFLNPRADFTPCTRDDVMAVLAWLSPDAMMRALEREIDALPDTQPAIPTAERDKRVAELMANLEQLERCEEALIDMAASEGVDVMRRAEASPAAVLGVVVKQRNARAA
jgi:hypothetical protein